MLQVFLYEMIVERYILYKCKPQMKLFFLYKYKPYFFRQLKKIPLFIMFVGHLQSKKQNKNAMIFNSIHN